MKMQWVVRGGLAAIGGLGMILFLIPFVGYRLLNIGNITGIILSALVLAYGVWMPQVHRLVAQWWTPGAGQIFLSAVGVCGAAVLALGLFVGGCMVSAMQTHPARDATAVVLGCRVYGTRASLMLEERIDAAYAYLCENPGADCIVSGGQGDGEDISEAECMARELIARGIDPERLHLEDRSVSTRENLAFSKEILAQQGMRPEIALITNEFHQYRAARIAASLDLDSGAVPADTAWWLLPTYALREMYGILYEWIF